MKTALILLAILLAGAVAWHFVSSADQPWLLGRWQYEVVAGDEGNDYLVFKSGGVVDFENDLGKYFSCVYWTRADQLTIECQVRGETRTVLYDISEDRRTLQNLDESSVYHKTGN